MKNWFKKIELDNYDVLVIRSSNHDDGEYIKVMSLYEDVEVNATMGFEDDVDRADKAFKLFDKSSAHNFVVNMEKAMTEE